MLLAWLESSSFNRGAYGTKVLTPARGANHSLAVPGISERGDVPCS